MFDDGLAGAVVDKRKEREDDGELRDANASGAISIDDDPEMAEPGDFGENEATDESGKGMLLVVALD